MALVEGKTYTTDEYLKARGIEDLPPPPATYLLRGIRDGVLFLSPTQPEFCRLVIVHPGASFEYMGKGSCDNKEFDLVRLVW